MACYSQHTPRLAVSGLPSHVSKPKVRMKLEDVVGKGKIISIDYITKTTAKVVVLDDDSQRKLLTTEISLQFGDNNYPIFVEKMVQDYSEDELESCDPSEDETFEYQPPDKNLKAIMRYLSKNEEHQKALEDALKRCNSGLIDISSDEMEVILPKIKRGGKTPQKTCEDCIMNFMKQFSCWNEKLEDCSASNVTYIISVLAKYKSKCFGTWYKDTKTILVIGPTEVVDEIKHSVENRLGNAEQADPVDSKPHSFQYEKVPAAVMRFVSRQSHYHSNMAAALANLAKVEIKNEDGNLSIHVAPTISTVGLSHAGFVQRCEEKLEGFFRHFDTWKGQFDKSAVKAIQRKSPDLIKTTSCPDHFVKWFTATGAVVVTGTCMQVKRCRQIIEQIFGVSSPQRLNIVTPLYLPSVPVYSHLHPIQQQPNMLHVEQPLQVSPSKSQQPQRARRISGSTSGDLSDEPGSSRPDTILFETENVPAAVLKYVSNDPESKKKLGKCCKKLAKVVIKNDHGQLKVYVTFKKKDFSTQDKVQVFAAVGKYFKKFDSITKKYEVEKLKQVVKKLPDLFKNRPGVYIKEFLDTGTVKITGPVEKISEKEEELDFEMNAEVVAETLPVDVFIAQRQCLVWERVEKLLADSDLKISISSTAPGKIQYKGSPAAIEKAKQNLGKVSMSLFQQKLTGLTEDQMAFLESCGKSQKEFIRTGKNQLDALYKLFKDNSIDSSLAYQDDGIDLVSSDHFQWTMAKSVLARFIIHFDVDLSDKPEVPFAKKLKIIKSKMEDEAVHMKEQPICKKIQVLCLEHQKTEMERKIQEIRKMITDVEEVERFYPMEEERAKHILNPHSQCKLYKAKSVKIGYQNSQPGLLITCEKEDIDSVDMSIEDLKLEIVQTEEKIPGYSLYELLTREEKHFRVERETKCSIFLKPDGEKRMQLASHVTVKTGNILNEQCHAIVNSTGKSVSFAGQVSKALLKKYGKNVLQETLRKSKWIVKEQVLLCPTNGYLPWNSILNVATPRESQMKSFILNLLRAADKNGITSIAIPTIGTGNMGLHPSVVAIAMKEAFAEFCSGNVTYLRDIRVVIFEKTLYSLFKDIPPEDKDPKSNGVVATIYGDSNSSLQKAVENLKEIREAFIKTAVLQDASLPVFPVYVKSLAREICQRNEVYLEWTKNSAQEVCHLEGIADNVNRAEDEMKKLLEPDFPHNWNPMVGDQVFSKVGLEETSQEYQIVEAKFNQSSPVYRKIRKIERIQNPLLYKQFKVRKEMRQTETKQLFHGTAANNVDDICASNFDRNFAGENGTAYGRGVYFHVNSSYSVRYAGQGPTKHLFLAEVITGDCTLGRPEYRAAPEKGNSKMQYDSVVDNTASPTIYVVFRDASAYPLYLISFF